MEKENPAFTAELDVSRGSSYSGFISGVRNQLVLHARATRHLELVLLHPQGEDPRKAPWFRVALRCGSSGDSALLRVRADNLYISGYQTPDGRWWEFRGSSVIDAATQLAFTDSYESMGRAGQCHPQQEGSRLSRPRWGSSRRLDEIALVVAVMMVCEAIRFRTQERRRRTRHSRTSCATPRGSARCRRTWFADGSQQRRDHIPQHLLASVKIDCQDHAMMALGVALNRQRPLQDRHRKALDEHWLAVRAQARKLDRVRT